MQLHVLLSSAALFVLRLLFQKEEANIFRPDNLKTRNFKSGSLFPSLHCTLHSVVLFRMKCSVVQIYSYANEKLAGLW